MSSAAFDLTFDPNSLLPFRWKIHESCMLAMGCVKSLIIDKVSNGKVSIDMTSFLAQVVLEDLRESGNDWNHFYSMLSYFKLSALFELTTLTL